MRDPKPFAKEGSITLPNQNLIKNLLLAFLPILIFVGADEFLSEHFPEAQATQYALLLAIAIGIGQAIYIFIRERRLDKMVLLDTGLIVLFGFVSLYSGNDIYFKLKPALAQLIMVVFLGVMAYLKPKLLVAMSGRMLQGIEIDDQQLKIMQKSAQGLVIILFLHTLLIVYSAFYMSKTAWAFIGGPLTYILAGLYFFGMIVLGKIKQRQYRNQKAKEEK